MRIRVSFTIDIDPEAWATEYGIDRSEVRADVQEHLKQLAYGQVEGDGLFADQSRAPSFESWVRCQDGDSHDDRRLA